MFKGIVSIFKGIVSICKSWITWILISISFVILFLISNIGLI